MKFYFSIIFFAIVFIMMGSIGLFKYYQKNQKKTLKPKDDLLLLYGIGAFAFIGYGAYQYYKNSPIIILNKKTIRFNNKSFLLADIEQINLTGKQPFRFAIIFPMEATKLRFKNGVTKYIFDDMYSNTWAIKSLLNQVVLDKKEDASQQPILIDEDIVSNDFYDTFKGNQFISMRGILLWGSIGVFSYLFLYKNKNFSMSIIIVLTCFLLGWFLGNSYLMHYFQVSSNFFIVKNHNLLWKKKAYNISDIKEVVFETQGKMPNCLRVITKNFKTKLYPASSLSNKTWLELKTCLESYSVEVRNECICSLQN